jgi:diguanylate cyclase (GGDEF)-like protein
MASAPDVLDLRASARDADATARDAAAERRDSRDDRGGPARSPSVDRMLAARDRAAAALDRREAALDRQRAREYRERAYRDELTGVLQRAAGRDQLVMAVDHVRRSGESLILVFLDVDHLKQLNDAQGHAAGDELLRAVGAGLLQHLRSYDVVVRYGGDEFVCALPGSRVPETTRRLLAVGAAMGEAVPGASVSFGLAELTASVRLDDAVARADRAMYAGRRESRGLTVVPQQA